MAASATEIKPSERISHKVFQVPYATGTTAESVAKVIIEKGMSFEVMMQMDEMRRVVCNTLLNSSDFLESLRGHDLIIHDAGASCSVLLAEYLGTRGLRFYRHLLMLHLLCTIKHLCHCRIFLK